MQHDEERYRSKNKRPRPYGIEYRWKWGVTGSWSRWYRRGKYRTLEERDAALKVLQRKSFRCCEYRAKEDQ